MMQWALELSRKRKARKAAVAAITPLVQASRQRLGGISDATWSDPYIVGFLVMLISIMARMESGRISADAMCTVQWRAWEDITTLETGIIAEQLLHLSTERNRDFEQGCHNAAAFSSILFGTELLPEGVGLAILEEWVSKPDEDSTNAFAQREDVNAAWAQFLMHIFPCLREMTHVQNDTGANDTRAK